MFVCGHACFPACLLACLLVVLIACSPACLRAFQLVGLLVCRHVCLWECLLACLPACLLSWSNNGCLLIPKWNFKLLYYLAMYVLIPFSLVTTNITDPNIRPYLFTTHISYFYTETTLYFLINLSWN